MVLVLFSCPDSCSIDQCHHWFLAIISTYLNNTASSACCSAIPACFVLYGNFLRILKHVSTDSHNTFLRKSAQGQRGEAHSPRFLDQGLGLVGCCLPGAFSDMVFSPGHSMTERYRVSQKVPKTMLACSHGMWLHLLCWGYSELGLRTLMTLLRVVVCVATGPWILVQPPWTTRNSGGWEESSFRFQSLLSAFLKPWMQLRPWGPQDHLSVC